MNNSEESKIVTTMITEYCRRKHAYNGFGELCPDCQDLLDYALTRLRNCPRGDQRVSCRKCVIHYYSSTYREYVREVMRHMGQRMVYLHPVMAFRHFVGEMRSR